MATDWLITGAGGQLGSVLLRQLVRRGAAGVGTASMSGPRPEVGEVFPIDLLNRDQVVALIQKLRPRYIIHAAAMTNVNDAYRQPDRARQTNVEMTQQLLELASEFGFRLVFISTDLVFGGDEAPYAESDAPSPRSVYGKTKAEAEHFVQQSGSAVALRLPLMFGVPAVDRPTTFINQLRSLLDRRELMLFNDEFRTPIWLEDAARACIETAQGNVTGILHAGGPERLSRLQMGELAAKALGVDDPRIQAISQCEIDSPEPRPADVSLNSARYESLFRHSPGVPMSETLGEIARQLGVGK